MAKIYLDDTSTNTVIGNSRSEIYGTGSKQDTIILNSDVRDVDILSTVEFVTLKDTLSDYQFAQGFGSNLEIYDNDSNLIAKMGSINGKTITINGEDFKLFYEDGIVKIGGNELSKEPIHIESSISTDFRINSDGVTLASDERAEIFTIVSGSSYHHKINNFDIFNDKLDFGEGITADDLILINKANDGKVFISYTPDRGSTTVEIELTGLDLKSDELLTTKDGLNSILNGYTPPTDDDSGETTSDYVNDVSIGDAGDSVAEATEITFTDDLDLIIKGFSDDNDNYSFIATSDGVVEIDLYGMSSNLDLSIYNGEEIIGSSTNSGDSSENLSFNVKEGETYTIAIEQEAIVTIDGTEDGKEVDSPSPEPETTNYNLYAWLKEEDSGPDESDDYIYDFEVEDFISLGDAGDIDEPAVITLDSSYNDAYLYGTASNNDAYEFVATQNGTLYITLSGMDNDLNLALYEDSELVKVSTNLGTDSEYISYEVREGDTYILNVEKIDIESGYDLSIFIA
jgi:hypothetical protein